MKSSQSYVWLYPFDCLDNCVPCLNSLVADYQAAGGVCSGSVLESILPDLYLYLYQVSDQECVMSGNNVMRGLCSETTLELLRDQENCVDPIWTGKYEVYWTASWLMRTLCDEQTYWNFKPSWQNTRQQKSEASETSQQSEHWTHEDSEDVRLVPIDQVYVDFARVPPLEDTKHRYPWICSLKIVGQQSSHFCAVTRKGTNPNYSYELYEFQYLLGIRRFVGTEMIKNLEFVGS